MIQLDGYVLIDLDLVDILEYCQSVSNTGNSHLFQLVVLQRY